MKKIIRQILARFGWEIRRQQPFGMNACRDVRRAVAPCRVDVVFDVGANVGQTSLGYLEEFPSARIYSFEPNPIPFAELKHRLAGCSRVNPHQVALGSAMGSFPLHVTESSLTSSMLPVAGEAGHFLGSLVNESRVIEVPVQTLDDFMERNQIDHIDLLKLDVQGFEVELLKGARRALETNRVSLILTELNFVPLYQGQAFFQDVYSLLTSNGFKLTGLYHGDYRDGPYITWCDGLFVNVAAVKRRASLMKV